MMTLTYHISTGDFRGESPGGTTIVVDADAHRGAVLDWLDATYSVSEGYASDAQYQAAREIVDDPAHWADLVDVEGSGCRSLAATQAEQEEGRDLFLPPEDGHTPCAYMVLPWGEYHRLNAHPHVAICLTAGAAWNEREDASDEILPVRSLTDAARAAETFRHLARAAWTPNQDGPTQDQNGRIMATAARILARLRDRSARLALPEVQPLTLPSGTLPAPVVELEPGPSTWRRVFEGLEHRYEAGLQSLLDRPDINVRLQAVVPRTGKGGGFIVVCRVGDDLRAARPDSGTPVGRWAEAELTFVLRRASSGSGRLILDCPCRRDPAGGPPFPRPYGRLTVVGSERTADGTYVLGGGFVATRWWLCESDAERLIRQRVLPELAWSWLDRVSQPAAAAAEITVAGGDLTVTSAGVAEFTIPKVQTGGVTVTGAGTMELPWVDASSLGAAWRPAPWALAEARNV